jgi:hypothetical protein
LIKIDPTLNILSPPTLFESTDPVKLLQYTLAELLILSEMQHLIVTAKSTFSMVAQGLTGRGAWTVRQGSSNERSKITSAVCEWQWTSEPEYQMSPHFLPDNRCIDANISHTPIGERIVL